MDDSSVMGFFSADCKWKMESPERFDTIVVLKKEDSHNMINPCEPIKVFD